MANTSDPVPVRDLARYGRVRLISVDDGTVATGRGETTCHGVCLPYPRPISAVFVHDDRVWLQIGRRRWDIDTIAEVRQIDETLRKATYELVLADGTHERVAIRFPWSVRIMRVIDPTHDEIDTWFEDIVKTLPYNATNGRNAGPAEDIAVWKARVLPLWRSGISSRP